VVDRDGKICGLISEYQLLETIYSPELASTSVDQLMTRNLLVVEETASVVDVTNLIVLHKIRRVPVVRQGQLVGLISRRDLLRYVKRASRSMRDFIDDTQAAAQSKVVQSTTEQSPTQQAPTQPAPVQPATVEQAMLQQPPTESTK
jgi:signal-transduction protein with cAMP-binding, CBS, and nucleotidyltransferase domain